MWKKIRWGICTSQNDHTCSFDFLHLLPTIAIIALLSGCGERDLSKPHEYIKVTGYGDGWASTENNARKFDHLLKAQIYAELGSGKCEKYLHSLDPETIFVEMAATNYLIHTEPESSHDIPIKYATLQCVAYHGHDQNCDEEKERMTSEALKTASDREEAAAVVLSAWASDPCAIRKEIGQARTFSLEQSRRYKFVSK